MLQLQEIRNIDSDTVYRDFVKETASNPNVKQSVFQNLSKNGLKRRFLTSKRSKL